MSRFGKKDLVLIGAFGDAWGGTQTYASGVTAAGLSSAGSLPAIPADVATSDVATATQTALNVWATAVGCEDPVFPLAVDGDYGVGTQGACALFQEYANETGAPAPPLAIDGLAGAQTWQWLQSYGAAPSGTTPSTPALVVPNAPAAPGAPWSTTTKIAVGAGVGLAILAAIYVAHEYA